MLAQLSTMKEVYQKMTASKCASVSEIPEVGVGTDVNKLVVTTLLTALEQSLQAPPIPEFLKVIDSITTGEESE